MEDHQEPILAASIDQTVQAAVLLHAEHERHATRSERFRERLIGIVARPLFVTLVAASVVLWIVVNAIAFGRTGKAFDPPPFPLLQGIVTLAALFMTILILGTQRRADRLAEHRAQLTLEIAIIAEQKSAKLIELMEEFRRDHPEIKDRHDSEASSMAKSADPEALLEAIKDTRAGMSVER